MSTVIMYLYTSKYKQQNAHVLLKIKVCCCRATMFNCDTLKLFRKEVCTPSQNACVCTCGTRSRRSLNLKLGYKHVKLHTTNETNKF